MTDYATNYETRYDGSLPNTLGTGQSDAFTNTRPQYEDDPGEPLDGYAQLDPKWLRFDPGGDVLVLAAVNTRTQQAELLNRGVKNLVGMYQQLPLPAATGEVIERAIYGATNIAGSGDQPSLQNLSGNFGGIFLADGNLATDPETTTINIFGMGILRGALDTPPAVIESLPVGAAFVAFDALPSALCQVQAVANGSRCYWRIRTRQTCTAPATFTSEAEIDYSNDGIAWSPILLLPTLTTLRTSFGFGIWCNDGFSSRMYQQMVQVVDQSFGDLSTKIGDAIRIGPV